MLLKGCKKEFWCYNAFIILLLSIGQHEWLYYVGLERYFVTYPYRILSQEQRGGLYAQLFFVLRNVLNLSICAGVATSVLMARRLSKAEEEKKEAEIAMSKAELVNLRQQVNPHFLLNTLNNIYALTAFNTEKAQKAKHWDDEAHRYVVYKFEKGEDIDTDNPAKIIGIPYDNRLKLDYKDGETKYVFVVTALDRMSNESTGKKKKVKL